MNRSQRRALERQQRKQAKGMRKQGLESSILTTDRPIAEIMAEFDAKLLDDEGRLAVHPSETYAALDHDELRVWCHHHAFYCLPTTELVAFLRDDIIKGRSAIEVGSGNGCLGRALGIPMTDSMNQRWPDVAMHYAMTGQPTVQYGEDVEEIDAVEAVRKYDPQVVIGAWVTHWIDPRLPPPEGGGSQYGLREDLILDHPSVENYVVVGNEHIHRGKPIHERSRDRVTGPMVWSRSSRRDLDCVYVWQQARQF